MSYISNGITADIRVAGEGMVSIEFSNRATERRYLVEWNAPLSGLLENNIFEFQLPNTRYVGELSKRPPPGPEHFIGIEPGMSVSTEPTDMTRYYRDPSGARSHVLRYYAYHGTHLEGGLPDPVVSGWIELPGSLTAGDAS